MEIVPMLDPGCQALPSVWYLLSAEDDGPSARVGHASILCQCPADDSEKDGEVGTPRQSRMIVVGGATPSGPFSDVFYLEMSATNYKWSKLDTEGLVPRYEHGITVNGCGDVLVFGGAKQDHNLSSVQRLKKGERKWEEINAKGCVPAPRTCLNTATINNKLYVFGGGLQGATPVSDTQMHVFDPDECSWTQLKCTGRQPTPRHGHVMVACGTKIYIHGGMAERELYSDLFTLDTEKNAWDEIKQSGDKPTSRAAHAGVAVDRFIYVFGGMNFMGALNDLYKFDVDFLVWSKIEIQGDLPPPRLDHTLCCIDHFAKEDDEGDGAAYKKQKVLLSFGGMDTTGHMFDDLYAIKVA